MYFDGSLGHVDFSPIKLVFDMILLRLDKIIGSLWPPIPARYSAQVMKTCVFAICYNSVEVTWKQKEKHGPDWIDSLKHHPNCFCFENVGGEKSIPIHLCQMSKLEVRVTFLNTYSQHSSPSNREPIPLKMTCLRTFLHLSADSVHQV